ncbi:MAG: ABC transporter substrate-binding protein [Desulfurococcales archaeon]|nr:ABC transporter substrate-binding protein [Desulfurococcales archaeon]
MKEKFAILLIAMMIIPVLTAAVTHAAYVQEIVIQRIEDDQAAITSLTQGYTQARLFRIRDINVVQNLSTQGFKYVKAASGLVNLLVNPADTCQDGSFNLFQYRKARFALQFLVDRDQIVNNIYKGYALPVITSYTPLDPDYPYLVGVLAKWEVVFKSKGPEYGAQLLEEALQEAGATKGSDGKWYYNGQPVTVKFVIRQEDARKDIGNLVADTLENLGLTVERNYMDFSGAKQVVYGSDPSACQWHLYTEGWGITGMSKYNYGDAVWFFSSIWGAMPGWGTEGYWNYKNETIDNIATQLDSGNYTSEDEFWSLLQQLVDLGIKESVRVFIAATYDFYVYSGDLSGIIPSPKASPWHTFTFMNLQYPQPTVNLSNRYVYIEGWAWNPVGGWQDFYSRPVVEAITWPAITSRVTDGELGWSPANTATWSVQRNVGSIPSDAIYYDTVNHTFTTVGEHPINTTGITINEVTINYKLLGQLKFHDGSTETLADLLAPIYVIFEYATDTSTNQTNDTRYESALARDYSTFLNTFLAVEIVNDTTVKVYTSYSHLDDGQIAQVASIWTSFPLELYAAMDLLWQYGSVQSGGYVLKYVYSLDSVEENKTTAIHLLDTVACDQMKDLLQNAKTNPPDWVQQLINMGLLTQQEWEQRVDNLINFYNQHHHMVVGNGPFYLDSYDAANDIAYLKRVDNFPVPVTEIANELQYKTASVAIDVPALAVNTAGTTIANITVQVNNQPATPDDVNLYAILLDLNNFTTTFLNLTYKGNGQFQATLPTTVSPGDYNIIVVAYPVGYSNPAMKVQSITLVAPSPGNTTTTSTTTTQTGTTGGTTSPPGGTTGTTTTSPTPTSKAGLIAAVIIIIIIIAGAAYYYARK